MTALDFLAAATAPTRLDPLQLFLDADIVVQAVIAGLLVASVWVWAIIVSFSMRMSKIDRKSRAFEREFLTAREPEGLLSDRSRGEPPSARVAAVGLKELQRSTGAAGRVLDRPRLDDAPDQVLERFGDVAEHHDDGVALVIEHLLA